MSSPEVETKESIKASVPFWAANVLCPECGGLMIPIHSKSTKWGENITYQCHNSKPYVVMTITTTVPHKMQPGDFELSDFDWRTVAERTESQAPRFEMDESDLPPCPWKVETNTKVIWEEFWNLYFRDGEVDGNKLVNRFARRKKIDREGKVLRLLETIPRWLTEKSGFVIVGDQVWKVVGKV